jgi:hypothetical protein
MEIIEGTATGPELDPYTVELSRGMKGQYGWTIKVRGKDKNKVLEDLEYLELMLRTKYPAAKGE